MPERCMGRNCIIVSTCLTTKGTISQLTARIHLLAVEILEYQHVFLSHATLVVKFLLRIVLQVHRAAHVMSSHVVCFNEREWRDRRPVTDGEWVVLNPVYEWSPDAIENVRQRSSMVNGWDKALLDNPHPTPEEEFGVISELKLDTLECRGGRLICNVPLATVVLGMPQDCKVGDED